MGKLMPSSVSLLTRNSSGVMLFLVFLTKSWKRQWCLPSLDKRGLRWRHPGERDLNSSDACG
jgi:hypothetical protein